MTNSPEYTHCNLKGTSLTQKDLYEWAQAGCKISTTGECYLVKPIRDCDLQRHSEPEFNSPGQMLREGQGDFTGAVKTSHKRGDGYVHPNRID